jgi:hypothetical protein
VLKTLVASVIGAATLPIVAALPTFIDLST